MGIEHVDHETLVVRLKNNLCIVEMVAQLDQVSPMRSFVVMVLVFVNMGFGLLHFLLGDGSIPPDRIQTGKKTRSSPGGQSNVANVAKTWQSRENA
ncbi:MAG: hypothetical protein R3C02_02525 [Planctomycetaceae bacterium]